MGAAQKLAYQCKRLKQISSTALRSVPPATARPFAAAPETFPIIAVAAKEKSWFNSHRGRVPRATVQVRGEHWVGLNIVRFVPEEVGKIQKSSRHTPRLDSSYPVRVISVRTGEDISAFLPALLDEALLK